MAEEKSSLPIVWPGWRTVRVLGYGSNGTVYEVERRVGKTVEKSAVKVISIPKEDGEVESLYRQGYDAESITDRFRSLKENIEEEYSTMVKLKGCSNAVYCDDIRTVPHEDGLGWDIFIRMELLTPVVDLPPEKMDVDEIVRLGKEICQALVMCREQNIVHRDVKPQNIFTAQDGTFKLGDFGIARAMEHTASGTMTGTYNYMAPEVELHRPYNSTVDIYSLGLVLYWFLNRRRLPFLPLPPQKITVSQELAARERRLHGDELPPPAEGSEELKRIVLKACAFEPRDRYQSAAEMLRDLEALPEGSSDGSSGAPGEILPEAEDDDGSAEENGGIRIPGPVGTDPAGDETVDADDETVSAEDETVGSDDETVSEESGGGSVKKRFPAVPVVIAALLALLAAGYFFVHLWTPATCTEPRTCRICGKTESSALGHRWGEWQTVAEPTCTENGEERRVCGNDPAHAETRALEATGHDWAEVDCSSPATCRVCGATSGGPVGHSWSEPVYEWSADRSTVTASHTCTRCGLRIPETVTAQATVVPAGCEQAGSAGYTADFTIPSFERQTVTVELPATGHSFGAASYQWASDLSSVTAKRVCTSCGHAETETVRTTSRVTRAAACGTEGTTAWTASFSDPAFETQTKTTAVPATGSHSFGTVSYQWASDLSSVTAKRVCTSCGHVETETVRTTSNVTRQASCGAAGSRTLTASFRNTAFATQTKTAAIPATGHSWGVPTYQWSSNSGSVTATRKCSVCGQTETETVQTTGSITRAATCGAAGQKVYTASFHNPAFSTQKKTVTVPATGNHSWRAATCTEPQRCTVCGATGQSALGHSWAAATYDEARHCTRCGVHEGDPKGYIGTLTGTWSNIPHTLGQTVGYPLELDSPVYSCFRMKLKIGISSYEGNPFGLYYLCVRDLNGNWSYPATFELKKGVEYQIVDFSFRSDLTFDAICIARVEWGQYLVYWGPYTFYDVQVR